MEGAVLIYSRRGTQDLTSGVDTVVRNSFGCLVICREERSLPVAEYTNPQHWTVKGLSDATS